MRAVVQRVSRASVTVRGRLTASIGRGFLVLAGFAEGDDERITDWMARKIASLRIFEDEAGKMNLSLEDVNGEILLVSQFTLYGDCKKGKRPSFDKSAGVDHAEALYGTFLQQLKEATVHAVKSGVFQEHMQVALVNDGPVTLIIEKDS